MNLAQLAKSLRSSRGLAAKADIAAVMSGLGLPGAHAVRVGDDCAAMADGNGFLLLAIEGFMNEFVARDPWFAGWCGVMVNISDVAAMGGRPVAVVDAIWCNGAAGAVEILAGMRAAAQSFGVPIIGGHSNICNPQGQLAVAILGKANKLLTSFDARPGDKLIAAIDLRGRYREPFSNWEAAICAPPERLRANLELLPMIAESGLSCAAKDISQAGVVGTAAMLAECSEVSICIDVEAVPKPAGVALERWLTSFPSYGYLLAASPENANIIVDIFKNHEIPAAIIGDIATGSSVSIRAGQSQEVIWDFATTPLMGCTMAERAA